MSDAADAALSFGSVAGLYERARPGYPEAALDWLLPTTTRRVLDLGAGTGKLTRQLTARGLDVIAVEPSGGMRTELVRSVPGVTVLSGTAESIPLDDASVDAVLVAQAWHWVDPVRALPEVARVLRPGGCLGLLWNLRDEDTEWVGTLGRLIHTDAKQQLGSDDPHLAEPFTQVEHFQAPWVARLTPAALIELVGSRSYVITRPPEARAAVLEQVRDLLRRHPDLAGRTEIELPYVTHCWRARR